MASGIYQIRNIINNHKYIGSSINTDSRCKGHIRELNKNIHPNYHLQHAWNKYGAENFEFSVLEQCFTFVLISREQHWINELKPEYNILPNAGSSLGVKHSPETNKKISMALKGRKFSPEHIASLSAVRKGRIFSPPGQLEKMSEKNKGNKYALGYKHTIETKMKMSAAHKGKLPPNTGKKASLETRQKLSIIHKGRTHTPESIEKMSIIKSLWWAKKKQEQGNE